MDKKALERHPLGAHTVWPEEFSETRKVKMPWEAYRERSLTVIQTAGGPKQPAVQAVPVRLLLPPRCSHQNGTKCAARKSRQGLAHFYEFSHFLVPGWGQEKRMLASTLFGEVHFTSIWVIVRLGSPREQSWHGSDDSRGESSL